MEKLYHHNQARDNCGFGMIANTQGRASHRLVETSLEALARMTHRGAIAADGVSGDGCGVLLQQPDRFLRRVAKEADIELGKEFAVGMVFLSQDQDRAAHCRQILEQEIERETLSIQGWRSVPINIDVCGDVARDSLPNIEQVFVQGMPGWHRYDMERRLFMARRRAAMRVAQELSDPTYYVSSLSSLLICYKALVMPKHLANFYLDLQANDFCSAISVFHQRFSTNTLPQWKFAQPFRFLAHNGEINTIWGNRNWSVARTKKFVTPLLPDLPSVAPLVNQVGSDSSSLDNMLEVFLAGGMDVFRSLRLLVPPAWQNVPEMDADLRAFYEFNSMHLEPWDGPAAIVMTNGEQVACTLDRNGLRPARYVITNDDTITLASEVGVWDYDEAEVIEKGRVGPGEMLAVDVKQGKLWRSREIDNDLKIRHPYRAWLEENTLHLSDRYPSFKPWDKRELLSQQKRFGITFEEQQSVIRSLFAQATEATGSMGDDTPVALLSSQARNIFDYFRQQFAQVTNPPIDPLREKASMSLETCIGAEYNVFQETTGHAARIVLESPVLGPGGYQQLITLQQSSHRPELLLMAAEPSESFSNALQRICKQAIDAVNDGAVVIGLSDAGLHAEQTPIHPALVTGAVHNALIKAQLRCDCNLVIRSGQVRDSHHFAVLFGLGATAVEPYLSYQTIAAMDKSGANQQWRQSFHNYRQAIDAGLRKILSKMGISTIASYRGAQLFEALGFDKSVVDLCFPGIAHRLEGVGFTELELKAKQAQQKAANASQPLPHGGLLKYQPEGEQHAFNPDVVTYLQRAVNSGQTEHYQAFADLVNHRKPLALRDLWQLKAATEPLSLDQVETAEALYPRFDTAAMSIGALSPEAHESLAEAMNQLGGHSNSGEGGEDSVRFGTRKNSRIKQVASGRFGVTAHYLINADVIQIKMAQGAKPGEGGQLPGHKVTPLIARLRHSVPGVTLISPPPHHDIYSIEDLAQLIFDLKQVNPRARISVKLVSSPGIGTIAAGVAKAYADMITISGYDGGTGASPLTSIKYAGSPWELGLAEVQQALVENGLRHKVRLQVDGGLKTGLDVVKAAILGAESFGFGTGPMVALGCKYLRICHLNNCATGVATQDQQLREKHFVGAPEKVIRYFTFLAEEVRGWLSYLNVASLNDLIGKTHLLEPLADLNPAHKAIDLKHILESASAANYHAPFCTETSNPSFDKGLLNKQLLNDATNAVERGESIELRYMIKNYHRSIGASLAGLIAQHHGPSGCVDAPINVEFTGTAGQSLGVWNMPGMNLTVKGDANDYVGKGMSGGRIVVRLSEHCKLQSRRHTILGNTCLYGATGGELFAAGKAGERFAVRNSGANAVVEGLGAHGCEYMTGGTVIVLGQVGWNFAAGMTGGEAYILDLSHSLEAHVNGESVVIESVETDQNESKLGELKAMIERHQTHTGSSWAAQVLKNFEHYLPAFKRVSPKQTPIKQTNTRPPAKLISLVNVSQGGQ